MEIGTLWGSHPACHSEIDDERIVAVEPGEVDGDSVKEFVVAPSRGANCRIGLAILSG